MVKSLIERVELKKQAENELQKYNDLDKFDIEMLWQTYKEVVPAIGASKVPKDGLTSELKEIVTDFRIRYLEE